MATVPEDLVSTEASPESPLKLVEPDHFTAWVEWMEFKEFSPNTIRLYQRVVTKADRDIELLEATTESLDAWVQAQGGKAGTKANRISALTCFFTFMVKTKRLPTNPAKEIDRPRQHTGVPKPVVDLETKLEGLDALDVLRERRVGESRDLATILAETGLRIHEAVALDVPVPAPAEITIIGKGHKEAIVLLTPKAREALDRLGGKWPIGARATQRRFEKVGMHPHALRHTRATTLVQKGVEIGTISKIMRHSSPAITMIYAQYDQSIMRKALEG